MWGQYNLLVSPPPYHYRTLIPSSHIHLFSIALPKYFKWLGFVVQTLSLRLCQDRTPWRVPRACRVGIFDLVSHTDPQWFT